MVNRQTQTGKQSDIHVDREINMLDSHSEEKINK